MEELYHSNTSINNVSNRIATGTEINPNVFTKIMPASTQAKQQTRSVVLSILKERSQKRQAVLLRDLIESKKIMAKWKLEETKANEEKYRALFDKLSQPKKMAEDDQSLKKLDEMRKKIELAEQRAREVMEQRLKSHPPKPLKEKLYKKEAEIQKISEMRKTLFVKKLEQADKTLSKTFHDKMLKLQLKRERREKQTLRSKVQLALTTAVSKSCNKFWKDYERYAAILQKDRLNHANDTKYFKGKKYSTNTEESQSLINTNEDLNAVLVSSLSPQEIDVVFFGYQIK